MKFISWSVSGRNFYGAVVGDRAIDLGRRFASSHPTLRAAIADGVLDSVASELAAAQADCQLSQVKLPASPISA